MREPMTKRFYPAVLEREGRGFFGVWFPDFPDCVAAGPTQEAAIQKAELTLAHAIDALFESERALPEPTAFDRIAKPRGNRFVAFLVVGVEPPDPSERVNIYLSKSLLARADRCAAELGMNRSSFFGYSINRMLGFPGLPALEIQLPRSKAERTGSLREDKAPPKKRKSR
jgi:predicted RNase H-like HicB family nuclease